MPRLGRSACGAGSNLWTLILAFWLAGAGTATMAQGRSAAAPSSPRASSGLTSFRSDAELRAFLRRLRGPVEAVAMPPPVVMEAPPPPPSPAAMEDGASEVVVTGSRIASPELDSATAVTSVTTQSITNTQEATVDEGGIVKVHGDTLVILRRGRLFTVSLRGGGMRPVDSINAFPPGVSGQGAWYDEMLLAGDRVIVVGYSYDRGGTEINRFRIDAAGKLRFEDAYHLRSNDYYSSRNYASRLIGNRLIFYTPLELNWERDPLEALPGVRQ